MKQPNDVKAIESNSTKELYFKNLSLIDLNENGVENQLSASSVAKYKTSFEFEDVNATYKRTHNLVANRAVYEDGLVNMEGNISLKRGNDFSFVGDDLIYDMEDEAVYVDKHFRLDMNGSTVIGENLYYNLDREEVKADFIRASIRF